ncbi:polysaccharide pyruvyl transferase family protein [Nocardia sp. 2TAF39]|uniref:polysaccharide pyruvyl transferase family protein n=1 Tax=Nocardia sp. 2TAF39 TaxID=3233017 RepID=UPI003F96C2BA
MDFPRHSNVGDSAIWLGERALLHALGVDLVYTCDLRTYSADQLADRVPPGDTILVHGGGNLGDLWPHHQRLREQIIGSFAQHRIIQLPQSVHFEDPDNLSRASAVFDAHPDLTLLLRDRRSLRQARRAFRARCILCPDSAMALPELPPPAVAHRRILWLKRTDHESANGGDPPPVDGMHATDWTGAQGAEPSWNLRLRTTQQTMEQAGSAAYSVTGLLNAYDRHAEQQLLRGCRLLGTARVVITDRLHAHLLCLLMGLPHVILDDKNGKVSSYWQTWSPDGRSPVVVFARTPGQAIDEAERLADAREDR